VSSTDFPGARWRKSSYSNGQANCVETAAIGQDGRHVAVRDSKAPAGPALTFRPSAWRRFTTSVKAARKAP
jgi:Domain of unknown function (DUF397)